MRFSQNIIAVLPLEINKMSSLTELVLDYNNLETFNPRIFTESLRYNLKVLDLSHNKVRFIYLKKG